MNIQCTDKKTFELSDGSQKLGQLTYDGIFSLKARATVGEEHYQIIPKGIFNTTISVIQKDMEVARLQMNWKGHITFSFPKGEEFILKTTGTFRNKYVLEDQHQQKLMLLDPDFNWAKFSYNYSITYDHKPQNALLVLLAAYAANYYMAAVSGTM